MAIPEQKKCRMQFLERDYRSVICKGSMLGGGPQLLPGIKLWICDYFEGQTSNNEIPEVAFDIFCGDGILGMAHQ